MAHSQLGVVFTCFADELGLVLIYAQLRIHGGNTDSESDSLYTVHRKLANMLFVHNAHKAVAAIVASSNVALIRLETVPLGLIIKVSIFSFLQQ